jgi:hypothetical protein
MYQSNTDLSMNKVRIFTHSIAIYSHDIGPIVK